MVFSLSKLFSSVSEQTRLSNVRTVGIDVGSSSVKVLELEETERALLVKTYGELQLGPYKERDLGAVVTLEKEKLIETLVDVTREAGVNATQGTFALPLKSSFITIVPITQEDNEQSIDNKIKVEARKYIPLPLSDVSLNWTELPPIHEGDQKQNFSEVLIAAVEASTIAENREILNAIGMSSAPSEIEAFSLVRALGRTDDTTYAVIDLGAHLSKLYIVRDGIIERFHRVVAGGAQITERVADLRSLTFGEAEQEKRMYNAHNESARDALQATRAVLEDPIGQFARIITQYEGRLGSPLERIVLAGGVSAFPETPRIVGDMLARDVERGNAFDKFAYPAFMEDTLESIAPTFGVSAGAALRYFMDGA